MHHIHKEAVCFGLEKESTVSLFGLLPSPHRRDCSSLWSPFTFPRTLTTLDNLTMVPGAVTLQTQLWEPENVRDRSGVPGRRRRDHSLSVGRRRGPVRGSKALMVLRPISGQPGRTALLVRLYSHVPLRRDLTNGGWFLVLRGH